MNRTYRDPPRTQGRSTPPSATIFDRPAPPFSTAVNTLSLPPPRHLVFDDETTHLHEEPFVLGATEAVSRLVEIKEIPEASKGFSVTFSGDGFDGHDAELEWLRADPSGTGNRYSPTLAGERFERWLCPALFCYFNSTPRRIYVRAEPLPAGISPFWKPKPKPRQEARRFVEAPQS